MSDDVILARQRQLIGSAAEWAANDLLLGDGELAVERPASVGATPRFKFGLAGRRYSELPYFTSLTLTGGVTYRGTADATIAAPASPQVGDQYLSSTAGTVHASWTGIAGQATVPGDALIYSASGWIRLPINNALAQQLANTTDAAQGAAMVGFNPTLDYGASSVGARLANIGIDPRSLGAPANGTDDDAPYMALALTHSTTLDLRNGTWRINSTIALPDHCSIDMRAATVIASTGAAPLFSLTGAKSFLAIQGSGGVVAGTASAFLLCQGTTNQPTSTAHYARSIRLDGVVVDAPGVALFLDLRDAVTQLYVEKCGAYTANAISASGKCVEVHISNSVLFGSSGAAGTYGIRLKSTGGGSFFNEGWHVVNSTVGNFETAFDVHDIFVLTVANSWVNAPAGGYAFDFHAPTTNLNEGANIGAGCVLGGKIRFGARASGVYNARVGGFTFANVTGNVIEIADQAANITIGPGSFTNGAGATGVRTTGASNNGIVCTELTFEPTYYAGVIFGHTSGANCSIGPLHGDVTGGLLWLHPLHLPVLKVGLPVATEQQDALRYAYTELEFTGTHTVLSDMAVVQVTCAKGERGYIDVSVPASGMNAATQRWQVTLPPGAWLSVPEGGGWQSFVIYPMTASGLITARIPYRCNASVVNVSMSLENSAGNSVVVGPHARFGLVREF